MFDIDDLLQAATVQCLPKAMLALDGKALPSAVAAMFRGCARVQEAVVRGIATNCKDTEFGREHGFEYITGQADAVRAFRERVPLSSWEDYSDYSARLQNGEEDLLFPGKAVSFSVTSGSTGAVKMVPESPDSRLAAQLITKIRNMYMLNLMKGRELGRLIVLTNATSVSETSGGIPYGSVSGQTLEALPKELAGMLAYPPQLTYVYNGDELDYMIMRCALAFPNVSGVFGNNAARLRLLIDCAQENACSLIEDIRQGSCALAVPDAVKDALAPFLAANPARAEELEPLRQQGRFMPKYYWSGLALACFWLGGSVGTYLKEIQGRLPEGVIYHDVGYGATEIKINIPTVSGTPAGALAACCAFFEFMPEGGGEPLLAHGLTDGERYELVVTTYAGLYRYNMHDLVQVQGYTGDTPNIMFISKLGDMGNMAQEKLPGATFGECMREAAAGLGLTLVQGQAFPDTESARYIACVEIENGEGVDMCALSRRLDELLRQKSRGYNLHRGKSTLKRCGLCIMKNGWRSFLFTNAMKGSASITQVKLPVIVKALPDEEWIVSLHVPED